MAWGTDRFFEAFARHGMVDAGYFWSLGMPAAVPLNLELKQPGVDILSDSYTTSDYSFEFESFAIRTPKVGDYFYHQAKIYVVTKPSKAIGNGYFSMVEVGLFGSVSAGFAPQSVPWDIDGLIGQSSVKPGPL